MGKQISRDRFDIYTTIDLGEMKFRILGEDNGASADAQVSEQRNMFAVLICNQPKVRRKLI